MFNALRGGAGQPPTVSTDTVVPLGPFEIAFVTGVSILHSTFIFDDVLDASKLKNSLWSLIERDGWRKLGARLRLNVTKFPHLHKGEQKSYEAFSEDNRSPRASYSCRVYQISTGCEVLPRRV